VPQDDVMLHELTVRENIAYSARIRLPRSWSTKEIEQFVDAILEALDLSHVAHNLITAISGGQRKRVNIGMELVTCPSAIFLDEPTSGLDATAALKVANTMKKIAMTIGITIVAVIHQPRFEIFSEFDDLLMIAP
jgi:ABC-type multidrug transport system ATPase subunit